MVSFKCLQNNQQHLRQWQIRLGVLSQVDMNGGYFHTIAYWEPQNVNQGQAVQTLKLSLYDDQQLSWRDGLLLDVNEKDPTKMKRIRSTTDSLIPDLHEFASLSSPFAGVNVRPQQGDLILQCQKTSGSSTLDLFIGIYYQVIY